MNVILKLLLPVNKFEPMYFWYLKNTIMEEVFFRYILLTLFGTTLIGAAVTILSYSLVHFFQFTWQMVIVAFWLGILLFFLYAIIPAPYNLVVCIAVHFVAGSICSHLGFTEKWKRKK